MFTEKLWSDGKYFSLNIANILYNVILILNAVILAISAMRLRKTSRSLHNVFPNKGLVKLHVANSIIFTFVYMAWFIANFILFKYDKASKQDGGPDARLKVLKAWFCASIMNILNRVFICYMDSFLLYLITRFTKISQKKLGRDNILNKDVPSILYVQNQQLLKDSYKTSIT